MFAALAQVNVDWNIFAGAVATFVVTAIVTAFGFRKGMKQVSDRHVETKSIAGASLMDNMSLLMLQEALKDNTDELKQIHNCLLQIGTLLQIAINRKVD